MRRPKNRRTEIETFPIGHRLLSRGQSSESVSGVLGKADSPKYWLYQVKEPIWLEAS